MSGLAFNDGFSAQEAGIKAAEEATQGSTPDIIIMCGSDGYEEHILAGISKVCKGVRVFGGSSSNDIAIGGSSNPPWQLYGGLAGWGALDDGGFVLLAIWQHEETCIHTVLSHCYGRTEHTGLITKAEGRQIYEIDGRLAADVLVEWTGISFPCSHADLAQYALAFDDDRSGRLVQVRGVGDQHELICCASTASDFGCSSAKLVSMKRAALTASISEVVRNARRDVMFDVRAVFVIFGAITSTLLSDEDFAKMQAILSEVAPLVLVAFTMGGQGNAKGGMDAYHSNKQFNVLFFG